MRLTRTRLAVALCAALLAPTAVAGPTLKRIEAEGRMVLAYRESSVPFSYADADGTPVGYAWDICRKLADAVRVKLRLPALKIVPLKVSSANRIQAIAEGKADLECGSTTNNAERRALVAFTVPHYVTGARYLVRADSTARELRDLETQRVVSTTGSTPLKAVRRAKAQGLLRIDVLEAADHSQAIDMVANGQADAFAMDEVLLYGLLAARPDAARFKVVGKYLTVEPLAVMLGKDDPELKRIVDDEMRRLIFSREIHALHDRWLMQPIPPRNNALNIPLNRLTRDFWKYPTDIVPD